MPVVDNIEIDESNEQFERAVRFVTQTNRSFFLTGKAGTGKTTFLKYIRSISHKKMAIVAPTGVAAVNAGGQTIHSFFKINPQSIFVPGDQRLQTTYTPNAANIYNTFQYNSRQIDLLKALDTLVIDEVSMVRCDLLDVIDRLLRVFRRRINEPFGGVQLVLIGDPFQLPPIARQDVWQILSQFYRSPFFFSAHALLGNLPVHIALEKIYRQSEASFINLLNKVRVNGLRPEDMRLLNGRVDPHFTPPVGKKYITLATHNETVNTINLRQLSELPGNNISYNAEITGVFPESAFPTERQLQIKPDAQVMFIKNISGSVYNGKIGTLSGTDNNSLQIRLSDGREVQVERYEWKNIRYRWNEKERRVEEETIGTFRQFPVRLAWAITVHKSQGLTFENVIADLGQAFASGQVYVALSRCSTFGGLVLRNPIPAQAIFVDPEVVEFARNETPETLILEELSRGISEHELKYAYGLIKEGKFADAFDKFITTLGDDPSAITEKVRKVVSIYFGRLFHKNQVLESRVYSLENDLKAVQAQLAAEQDNIQILNSRKTSLEDLLKKERDASSALETDKSELKKNCVQKEKEFNQLEIKYINLEKQFKEERDLRLRLEGYLKRTNTEIERLKKLKWYHKLIGQN